MNSFPPTSATTTAAVTTAPSAPVAKRGSRAWIRPPNARAMPVTALTIATNASATGDPTSGMTTNGTTNVPTIAPNVLAASSRPARLPISSSSPATRLEAAGKVRPMTNVAGRTTRIVFWAKSPNRSPMDVVRSMAAPPRLLISTTMPSTPRTAMAIWAAASRSTIRRSRVRRNVKARAPSARPSRKIVRMSEKT